MILYVDNTAPRKYDENGYALTNWNPDLDYGTQHVDVHFHIHTKGYEYPSFRFTEEDRAAFDHDIRTIFTALGWKCESEVYNGTCSETRGTQNGMYIF